MTGNGREILMGTHQTESAPHTTRPNKAYWLGPGEGDRRWVIDELDTIKATAAQTGGLFGLKESKAPRGAAPPLHVHEREDEACYVLEGDVTFFVGDDAIRASAGAWAYLPRGIPHTMRIDSSEARTLWLVVPGGFEAFFADTFPAAEDDRPPAPPGLEQIAEAAATYGVTLLGAPPQ
jgi:quercetin dioxygenase-like cupin family protein